VQQNWKALTGPASIGLEFCLSVLVGLFGGRWLDSKLGTSHWLTFIGLGFGIAAGYRAIYRATVAANQQAERDAEREKSERQRYHDHDKHE
jgi:ATP synthase protein I